MHRNVLPTVFDEYVEMACSATSYFCMESGYFSFVYFYYNYADSKHLVGLNIFLIGKYQID